MKKTLFLALLFVFQHASSVIINTGIKTVFEKTNGTETATYQQTIDFYKYLASAYTEVTVQSIGNTDSGKPLHIVTYNNNGSYGSGGGDKTFAEIRKTKSILLINNGIHPGESDGIDATMMLFRDLFNGKIKLPKNVAIVTIPIYNIGGSLNRNSTSRTNQNGPKEYGFRGNARNYDLNRDFIKNDTLNATSFAKIFHLVKPDVFIDNHVSNGADYQYVLTHLFTQHNKLGGELGKYINQSMQPNLEKKLRVKNWDITPYVNVFNRVPETGFQQFMDHPRYSTGYTALFNTLGMMVETHMLKPYNLRVEGTYELMVSMIDIMETDFKKIKQLRKDYFQKIYAQEKYSLDWQANKDNNSIIDFKGYEGVMKDSKVTNAQRLKYDKNKPFVKPTKYFNQFIPKTQVVIPKAYIIPLGWHKVINLLKLNKVEMIQLKADKAFDVESYRIENYETRKSPYEGHYQHFNTQINSKNINRIFKKGDYLIELDQPSIRYIIETLEPQAPDSFFNWNFFDTILQQKEGFSPYVFEEIAEKLLLENPDLHKEFNQKLKDESDFNENWYAQLSWIHKHSKYYEKAHMQYPVYRILK